MNSTSKVMNGQGAETTSLLPSAGRWGRQLYWCVRRELWESRSIYIAPVVAGALALAACSISALRLPERMESARATGTGDGMAVVAGPFDLAALLIMGVTFLVALFYSLDALHGERRDRSILFWKSLPVSDFTTVLAKASIPMLVLPALTFGVTFLTQIVVLAVSRAALAGHGLEASGHFSFWHMEGMLLYHLFAIHGFLYAPFYAWLMLVSAWARRLPILWATLPPAAVVLFEKVAFHTSYFAGWIGNQLGGGSPAVAPSGRAMSIDSLTSPGPAEFLAHPRLWLNLLIAAALFALAARLRRQRGPI